MAKIEVTQLLKMGFSLLNNGDFKQSGEVAYKILNQEKNNTEAQILLGLSYYQQREFLQSIEYLEKAVAQKPFDKALNLFYLENLLNIGEHHKGLDVIKRKESFMQDEKLFKLKLQFYEKLGLHDLLVNEIQAKGYQTKNIFYLEKLAWHYELLNEIEASKKCAKQGLKIDGRNFKCNLVMARIFLRKSHLKKATKYLKNIQKQKLSKINQSIYYSVKAQINEKKKKFDKAFKFYTKSNNCLKQTDEYKLRDKNSIYSIETIEILDKYFNDKPQFKTLKECNEAITFMVGFPRSGTTLLENILDAHSDMSSIEEKPIADNILTTLLNSKSGLHGIEALSLDEINAVQNDYLKTRQQYHKEGSKIVIDKLPLNLIHVGLLYRVFPNAKFIISMRDIRDVALSCYFQNFEINTAMAYFLDWDKTYQYLMQVFKTAIKILHNYPIQFKIIEYEDMVEKPFEQVKDLIHFLGLEWDDNIYQYRKEIKGKNINTPSYAAVSKKVNTKQKNRWVNYKEQTQHIDAEFVFAQIQKLKNKV